MITRIGKYQIEGELGRGGFGRVYRAFDPTVGRPLAIKVLTAEGDPSLLTRFRNEAFAAGNLQHKNIVTVYDYGEYEGVPYLAMEYLDGENLSDALARNRPITLLEKIHIMREVAEGLGCAHRHDVIHRDVKPANIMLLSDGNVKIMDFGIARLVRNEAVRLTQTGYMVGTLPYMAPEQLGPNSESDILCDIWSYGVIYYEMLTGANPFNAGDVAAILYRLATYEPPRPSTVCQCPMELDDVIAKLLRRDREDRYQNLGEVQYDVEPIFVDLRRREAARLLAKAREHRAQSEIEQADSLIRQALDLDASNTEARQLREELRRRVQQLRKDRPKAGSLIAEAEQKLSACDYDEAARLLESARALDPTNTRIGPLLAQISAARERFQKSSRLLQEAEAHRAAEQLTLAREKASEACKIAPENEQANSLLRQLEQELSARERTRQLRDALTEVRGLIFTGALDEAIARLTALDVSYPETPDIVALLERSRQQKLEKERRDQLNTGLSVAKELIQNNRLDDAIQALERLAGEFPGTNDIEDSLNYAREQMEARQRLASIESIGRAAWAMSKAKDFDGAVGKLEDALNAFPGEERLTRLLRAVMDARAEHEWEQDFAELNRRQEQGSLADALLCVNRLLDKYAGDGVLLEQKRHIEAALEQEEARRKQQDLETELQRTRAFMARREFADAGKILDNLTRQYPNEGAIAPLAAEVQQRIAEEARRNDIASAIAAAAALEQASDRNGALLHIRQALARYPATQELSAVADRLDRAIKEEERREALAGHVRAVEEALRNRNWPLFQERLHDAEIAFPGEARLAQFRDDAAAEQRREDAERQRELDRICGRIRELLSQENWDDASGAVTLGLQRFPNNATLLRLRDQLQTARERRQALDSADQELRQGHLDRVEGLLRGVLAKDRNDSEALALLKDTQRRQGEQKRQQEIAAVLAEAQQRERAGDFTAAVSTIEQALTSWPATPELIAAADRLRRLQDEAKRRQALEQKARNIEQALQQRDWGDCARLLDEAEAIFPNESRLRMLRERMSEERAREEASRRRDLDEIAASIRDAIAREDWNTGSSVVTKALARFPGHPTLSRLNEELISARQRRENLTEAERKLRQKAFAEAEAAVQAVLAQHPKDSEAEALSITVRKQRERDEKNKQYAAVCEELERLSRERNYEQVVRSAKEALAHFPGDAVLQNQLNDAIAARDLAERNRKIAAALDKLELLFNEGRASEVRDAAIQVLALHEEPRARELLNWAVATLRRPPVDPAPKGRKLWAWSGVAAAVVITGGLTLYFANGSVGQLVVQPDTLSFTNQEGSTTASPPQRVRIRGAGANLTVSATDAWLTARADVGSSPEFVTVSIDSNNLAPGRYSGYVNLIDGKGRNRSIAVHATIQPRVAQVTTPQRVDNKREETVEKPKSQREPEPPKKKTEQTAAVTRNLPPLPKTESTTPAPEPPKPEPPKQEQVENVPAGEYSGPERGKFTWTGNLAENGRLVIGLSNHVAEGSGRVQGSPLPGIASVVTPLTPGVTVEEAPSAANHFAKVVVRNTSNQPVYRIDFSWKTAK